MSEENISNSLPKVNIRNFEPDLFYSESRNFAPPPQKSESTYLGNGASQTKGDSLTIYPGLVEITDSAGGRISGTIPVRGERDISSFSRHSRYRLMQLTSRINLRSYKDVVHCIYTYHNTFPQDSVSIRRVIKLLTQRLTYHFPDTSYIWRFEFQKRGAPHFHVLFFNRSAEFPANTELLRVKLSNIWLSLIRENSVAAKLHAVAVTRCENKKKFFVYVSKYAAKVDDENSHPYCGRRWGCSDNLTLDGGTLIRVNHQFLTLFKKKLYQFLSRKKDLSEQYYKALMFGANFTCLIDEEDVLQIYEDCRHKIPPGVNSTGKYSYFNDLYEQYSSFYKPTPASKK